LASIASALVIAGCATPAPPAVQPVAQTQRFERATAAAYLVRGTGQVRGAASIRKSSGSAATCAGNAVDLIPATPYADERMNIVFGPNTGSAMVRPDRLGPQGLPEPASAEYLATTLKTRCDGRGNFYFDQVASGAFWIQTSVRWSDGDIAQGGLIAQRIDVQPGQTVNLVMAP
jgi:hypothetical protein